MTTVIDASTLVSALVQSDREGLWAESVIAEGELAAPELILVESSNTLRRLEQARIISRLEATSAHNDLVQLPIQFFPFSPLAPRIWELRHNLTSYDAWYIALAEALKSPLATLDRRLSRAGGPVCEIITPPYSERLAEI